MAAGSVLAYCGVALRPRSLVIRSPSRSWPPASRSSTAAWPRRTSNGRDGDGDGGRSGLGRAERAGGDGRADV